MADLRISAAIPNDQALLARAAATISPVRIPSAKPDNPIPQTSSPDSSQKTAGSIVSIPDIPMPAAGIIVVPPANQIATIQNLGTESFGRAAGAGAGSQSGVGNSAVKAQAGAADAHGVSTRENAATRENAGPDEPTGRQGMGAVVPRAASSSNDASGDVTSAKTATPGTTRIDRPKEGRFNVVVFGASASEAYPESVGLLTGKLVYTVYLRVGLVKNWILQYCLPRAVEQESGVKGSATAVDAPWPFLMLRPDLPVTSDRDYFIVHGSISSAGRFEQLALILPEEFAEKKLLLNSLAQWEFRPATRDGQPVKVEVLLIIPRAASV